MDGRALPAIHWRGRLACVALALFSTAPGCDEGVPFAGLDAAADAPDGGDARRLGDPCTTAADCDDGVFCDGPEDCFEGRCIGARSTTCRDFGGCAVARCDEASFACIVDLPATVCASGTICAPDVGCVKVEGCTSDAACDDGRACTDDHCDLASGGCRHVPVDARCGPVGACGAPVCIGELAADESGCAAKPDASRCALDEGCDRTLHCVPLPASCTTDRECADGNGCDGRERCDGGRCVHGGVATCVAHDACHHALCRDRATFEPYCLETQVEGCP